MCVCAVLSQAGRVQEALGQLCAGDKGDSSVFKRVCLCVCKSMFVLWKHVYPCLVCARAGI